MLDGIRCRVPEPKRGTGLCVPAARGGLVLGSMMGYGMLSDRGLRRFIAENFAMVTPVNDMKADVLLVRKASAEAADGMPVMDFYRADRIVQWARTNGMSVHGHALAYHASVPDWFFRERYDPDGAFADRETVCRRMECYIDRVIRHFEEKFPGTVVSWDVVNEPLGDNELEYDPSDPRQLRISRLGVPNPFLEYMGSDYVEKCFLYARNTVDALGADIRLFLNEFNTLYERKLGCAIALAEYINAYARDAEGRPRRLIDGIGMEGYIGGYGEQKGCLLRRDIPRLENAIKAYTEHGLEVRISELTVRNFDASLEEEHAAFVLELFAMLRRVSAESGEYGLKNVSLWGVVDQPCTTEEFRYNWNPHGGLLREDLTPKDVFFRLREALSVPLEREEKSVKY